MRARWPAVWKKVTNVRNQTVQLFGFKGSRTGSPSPRGSPRAARSNGRGVTWIVTQLREKMAIDHDRSLLMMFSGSRRKSLIRRVFITISHTRSINGATTVNRRVAGSSPARGATSQVSTQFASSQAIAGSNLRLSEYLSVPESHAAGLLLDLLAGDSPHAVGIAPTAYSPRFMRRSTTAQRGSRCRPSKIGSLLMNSNQESR